MSGKKLLIDDVDVASIVIIVIVFVVGIVLVIVVYSFKSAPFSRLVGVDRALSRHGTKTWWWPRPKAHRCAIQCGFLFLSPRAWSELPANFKEKRNSKNSFLKRKCQRGDILPYWKKNHVFISSNRGNALSVVGPSSSLFPNEPLEKKRKRK